MTPEILTFSFDGLRNPDEVAVAWHAVQEYRRSQNRLPQVKIAGSEETIPAPRPAAVAAVIGVDAHPAAPLDVATAEVSERVYQGLNRNRDRLGRRYVDILSVWYNAPEGEAVPIGSLAKKLQASPAELRANLAKLSSRMRAIATFDEIAALRTPFLLLADIEYDENNTTRHRLTPAGREAARRFLFGNKSPRQSHHGEALS